MAAYSANDRDELERFKREINLTEYAAHLGYDIDRRTSSRHSITMLRAAGNDKVVVARDQDGHWIYFSVHDDQDNGSVIDFHQHRTGNNLGTTRQALRAFLGLDAAQRPKTATYAPAVDITPPRDQAALDAELLQAQPVSTHAYLGIFAQPLEKGE